jgi:hypothetical protein
MSIWKFAPVISTLYFGILLGTLPFQRRTKDTRYQADRPLSEPFIAEERQKHELLANRREISYNSIVELFDFRTECAYDVIEQQEGQAGCL